ncbi:alpha/beta fold hydrolase [Spongiimicrobium salis]|uniref:alpha/beta fold hydrolase n=1 Tax=Spongiimicrobium salis TaxID=1667022 RepID=UPI00374DED68
MKQLLLFAFIIAFISCNQPSPSEKEVLPMSNAKTAIQYQTKEIQGVNIAYRESGNRNNPTLILLHGFPASSHQYRKVLHELSDDYHMIAPDYPGFGESDFPSKEDFEYTFDHIATVMDAFVQSFGLDNYTLMIQDYGAPIGFRIATAHPEKVNAIINQNGNAYEAGLGEAWAGVRDLWREDTKEHRAALLPVFSKEGLKWQYTHGTRNPESVNPDTWNLDYLRLSREGAHEVNLDLFYDYQNNLKLYPQWQEYMRTHQPPMLIVWGKNDAFFPESGAAAYKADLKNIDYHILDTGHFALEEDGEVIMKKMRSFMEKLQ